MLEERGLSLREAARRAGCSPGYLSNAAHGRKPLTPSVAARLDRVLGTGDTFAAHALNPRKEARPPAPESANSRSASMPHSDRRRRDDGQPARNAASGRTSLLSSILDGASDKQILDA
jgi:transcriptional regulator with XRE-family HTH domain